MIEVEISIGTPRLRVDEGRIATAAQRILQDAGFRAGAISVAVVDDATIHVLNRRHLQHDYPTDVLSFILEQDEERLEGEVIVSADTAAREATRFGWQPEEELLLYVVHGLLHLVGHDDATPEAQATMREREIHYLAQFGQTPNYRERRGGASRLGNLLFGMLLCGVLLAGCTSQSTPPVAQTGNSSGDQSEGSAEDAASSAVEGPALGPAEPEVGGKWGSHTQGLPFVLGYEVGLAKAKEQQKPALFFVTTTWCGWCKKLSKDSFNDPKVRELMDNFVLTLVDGDVEQSATTELGAQGFPYIVFRTAAGEPLAEPVEGYVPRQEFTKILEQVVAESKAAGDTGDST